MARKPQVYVGDLIPCGEDRLFADVAGRDDSASVALLIHAGADLTSPGLDDGTPLHQAAWFGQPANTRLLIDAGANKSAPGDRGHRTVRGKPARSRRGRGT